MSVMFSLLSWFLLVTAAGGGLNNNLATAEEMIASNTAVVTEYWHTMLPNTVMPLAILDLLTPPAVKMAEDKYVGESSLKARKMGLHSTKEAYTHSTKVRGPSTTNEVRKSNYRWGPSIISGIQRFWGTSTTNDVQKSNYRWGPSTTKWGPSTTNDVQKSNYRWGPSATNDAKKSNYRWGPSTTNDLQRFWGQSRINDIQKSNYRWGPSTINNDQKSNYRWGLSTNDAQKSNYRWGPSTTNDIQKSNYRWGPSTTTDVQKSNYRWGPSTTTDVQKSNYRWGPSTTDVVRKSNYRWGPSTTNDIHFMWGPSTTKGIQFGWGPSTTNGVQKSNYRWGPSTKDDDQKRSPSTTAEYQKGDQNGVTPLEMGESNIDRDNNKHGTMSNMVFLEEALKPGSTISCYIQPSSTTGAPLLRRDIADSIPMSTGNFANIMTMFAPASNDMVANIWSTLELCEHPQAIKGETKACTTSVESMVEFVASALGVSTNNLRAFSSPDVPAKGVMTGMEYKVMAATRVTAAKDTVTCHGVGFPFAMFMCHAVNPTRVYSVTLEGEEVGADDAGQRMEVLAVCHLDTSDFDPAKMPVHVKPGDAPLCHFISRDSILWAPFTPTSGHATT